MAGLRKGRCYKEVTRAYTRKSKFRKKGFIKAVPPLKIIRFDMGDTKKKFEYQVDLISKEKGQIRQNSIESVRQLVNRKFSTKLGNSGYYLKIRKYPHHVLRENKMLTGAHADRMQTGMQRAFGSAIGLAAQVKKGSAIFTAYVDKKDVEFAKVALKTATPRLPLKCTIEVNKLE